MVWSGGEYLPTSSKRRKAYGVPEPTQWVFVAEGKLVTPITHLEENQRYLSILRENFLLASMLQANPLLVSRGVPRANADNDGAG